MQWKVPVMITIAVGLLAGCSAEPRFEIQPASGEFAFVVYRLDRETGEVCAYSALPVNEAGRLTESFAEIGCAGDSEAEGPSPTTTSERTRPSGEPDWSRFGLIPVDEPERNRFGGIPVADPPPSD